MSDIPRIGPVGSFDPAEDDETVAALRGALLREAGRVTPSPDGLQQIRRELQARRSRPGGAWISRFTPALTAAAAVAVLAVAGAVAVRINQVSTQSPAGPPPAATSQATTTPEAPVGQLPVYVVGEQGGRRWLFREFRPSYVRGTDDRVAEAVTDAVNDSARNPRYQVRLFRGGNPGQAKASVTESRITVTLTAAMVTGIPGATLADAELAVQQIVWTATAAAADRPGSPVRDVLIRVSNGEQSMFGQLPLDRVFTRSTGADDPQAPLWIISLADGTNVGRRPFAVAGDAWVGTGGSVTWVLSRDGVQVQQGEATLGKVTGTRTGWSIPLAPGRPGSYELTVTLNPGTLTGLPALSGDVQDARTFIVP